jgi:hypothetical protein
MKRRSKRKEKGVKNGGKKAQNKPQKTVERNMRAFSPPEGKKKERGDKKAGNGGRPKRGGGQTSTRSVHPSPDAPAKLGGAVIATSRRRLQLPLLDKDSVRLEVRRGLRVNRVDLAN